MNFDSPSHSPGLQGLAGNIFNWTLSYRADSDIFVPYGYLYPRTHPSEQPPGLVPPLARKQGLVAWVVSNWDKRQARVRYYRQLSQFVPVDVFGKAGPGQPLPDAELVHTVARYKFYLAFENSQHLDYITEELWRNAFLAGAVPIMLGPNRTNYERFVPSYAFIHVDDFPSASSLAAHLQFLDATRPPIAATSGGAGAMPCTSPPSGMNPGAWPARLCRRLGTNARPSPTWLAGFNSEVTVLRV